MDPKSPAHAPGRNPVPDGAHPTRFPRLDDHLVRPETREEMFRGHLVMSPPAEALHAERHYVVNFVTGASLAPGYVGASNLLTRVGPDSDFATNTCIRREGMDPKTGERHLEELAFQIVGEHSDVTVRAEELATRGVRRIIAIFAKSNVVCEWSHALGDWLVLDPEGALEDPTLAQPIPIRALIDRTEATQAVVRAVHAKQVSESLARRLRQGIEALCQVLEIPLDADRRVRLKMLDVAGLEALLTSLSNERRWP